jgi:hypothetical protein
MLPPSNFIERIDMHTFIVTSGFAAGLLIAGAAVAAHADTLDVKVPFPFVVHGQTLPAGEYRVETDGPIVMLRGEHGNRASVIFTAMPATGHDPAGDSPVLTFKKGETQYQLADIWESATRGETVVVF